MLAVISALAVLGCTETRAEGPVLVAEGFESPCGLGFDGRGRLYVAEAGTGRVLVLGQGGEHAVLASDIEQLAGLAVDRDNRVHVVSRSRGEVLRIGPRGERMVVAAGLREPQGLLAERFGGLLIFEGARGRVLRLGRDGRLRVVVERQGNPGGAVRAVSGRATACVARAIPVREVASASASGPGMPGLTLAVAPSGTEYIMDRENQGICTRLGSRLGRISIPDGQDVTGLGCDRDGALFFCTRQGRIYRVSARGA